MLLRDVSGANGEKSQCRFDLNLVQRDANPKK